MALIDSLVAYWKLDDNLATTSILDAYGSFDGTASNNTEDMSAVGKIGTSIDFNGSSETITFGDVDPVTGSTMSISAWIYADAANTGTIIRKRASQYIIDINANGTLRWYAGGKLYTTTGTIGTVGWHHIVAIKNGTTLEVYIDGSSDGSDTGSSDIAVESDNLNLGHSASSDYYNGRIDEVGIWSKALSSAEVAQLWNSGSGIAYPFSSDVTVEPATLTASTTALEPTIRADQTVIEATATLLSPTLSYPKSITVSTLTATATVNSVTIADGELIVGGRGQAAIRTSSPPIDYGEVLSLVPEQSKIFSKQRVGLDL